MRSSSAEVRERSKPKKKTTEIRTFFLPFFTPSKNSHNARLREKRMELPVKYRIKWYKKYINILNKDLEHIRERRSPWQSLVTHSYWKTLIQVLLQYISIDQKNRKNWNGVKKRNKNSEKYKMVEKKSSFRQRFNAASGHGESRNNINKSNSHVLISSTKLGANLQSQFPFWPASERKQLWSVAQPKGSFARDRWGRSSHLTNEPQTCS